MPQPLFEPIARRRRTGRAITIAVSLIALLIVLRSGATLAMEWGWWSEVGQLDTWLGLFTYAYAPVTAGTILAFAALWITSRRLLVLEGSGNRGKNLRIHNSLEVLSKKYVDNSLQVRRLQLPG
jgi:hypothetical protein